MTAPKHPKTTTHTHSAHTHSKTEESAPEPSSTEPSATAPADTTPAQSPTVATAASSALALLKEVTGKLPIDDALPPKELTAAKVANRVPLAVMTIASSILNEDPSQYPQFDAAGAQSAVDYEQAMGPVAQAAQTLADRIQKSILKSRSTAANQALALYAVIKGTARLPANEQSRVQVKTMGKLLATTRKNRATQVTQKETDQVAKTMRSQKKADVAKAAVDDATTKAALASAQASLDAGVIPGAPVPPAPPSTPAPAGSNGAPPSGAPSPSH